MDNVIDTTHILFYEKKNIGTDQFRLVYIVILNKESDFLLLNSRVDLGTLIQINAEDFNKSQ